MAAKTTARKWIKICILGILAAFLLYLTVESAFFLETDYGRWIVNRGNVQERLYESIDMLYLFIQFFVLMASLLALTVHALFRVLHPERQPGKIVRFLRKRGLLLALLFTVLLIALLLLIGHNVQTIRTTVETSEVPAALREHHRVGWLGIAAEISFLAALISFVSGIKGRKHAALERRPL